MHAGLLLLQKIGQLQDTYSDPAAITVQCPEYIYLYLLLYNKLTLIYSSLANSFPISLEHAY